MNIENEREENISVENYLMTQMEERELIYQQRALAKKQAWANQVKVIEQARDENNERKKLEDKIQKLLEKEHSKSAGVPV